MSPLKVLSYAFIEVALGLFLGVFFSWFFSLYMVSELLTFWELATPFELVSAFITFMTPGILWEGMRFFTRQNPNSKFPGFTGFVVIPFLVLGWFQFSLSGLKDSYRLKGRICQLEKLTPTPGSAAASEECRKLLTTQVFE